MSPLDARMWTMWNGMALEQKRRMLAVMERLLHAQNRAAGGSACSGTNHSLDGRPVRANQPRNRAQRRELRK